MPTTVVIGEAAAKEVVGNSIRSRARHLYRPSQGSTLKTRGSSVEKGELKPGGARAITTFCGAMIRLD
eukprot:scaffold3153_cov149-Skeletonema_marinoi.AAC.17